MWNVSSLTLSVLSRDALVRWASGPETIASDRFWSDRNISVQFPPYEPKTTIKMRFSDFKETYGKFEYDTTLLYVHLGQVSFDDRPKKSGAYGTGRTDLKPFFDWLHDKKGVRDIVKVLVEDMKDPAHGDEAIEAALRRFSVEILDWRKTDLCPHTILQACESSTLQELHLWWSGNNTTLRAWSEPDGLAQLQDLRHLHIHRPQV